MQRRERVVPAVALVVAMGFAGRAFAADAAGPAAVPSCKVLNLTAQDAGKLSGLLAGIAPTGELKTSCPAPYCVTNHDCAIRPPGDANSTCVYGKIGTPPGCGYCYY
jgi:hypothetical protein